MKYLQIQFRRSISLDRRPDETFRTHEFAVGKFEVSVFYRVATPALLNCSLISFSAECGPCLQKQNSDVPNTRSSGDDLSVGKY
jgi:hypothetical protein